MLSEMPLLSEKKIGYKIIISVTREKYFYIENRTRKKYTNTFMFISGS